MRTFRTTLRSGLCALALVASAASAAALDDPSKLLEYADSIKSAKSDEFAGILAQLEASGAQLSPNQVLYLRYLRAWQIGYGGDYKTAIPMLRAVIDESGDPTLRFRATVTVVNSLAIAARYEEAYSRLSEMLEALPAIKDSVAHEQALVVAAILYNGAGQYALARNVSDRLLAEHASEKGVCEGWQLKITALNKSGELQPASPEFQQGIDACTKAKEPLWGNLIRLDLAKAQLRAERPGETIRLLGINEPEARRTRYPRLISDVDATLARAYVKSGDLESAQKYALMAVDSSVKNEFTEPLAEAYEVLYEVAKKHGDSDGALGYHEKYASVDKGYLSDASVRTLAYQMVNQQVLDKKRQIDALNEKNQVLLLQQKVDAKSAETERLYILLLLSGLAFIVLWAYKTKRSQIHFMKLARRDGLTGIFNRQHFIDAASDLLRYCAKSSRDACVIVIDLDHFKLVNDVHGHAAGDLVLKRAVRTCLTHLRSIDVFGRLGGEEFGIVLPDCALDVAQHRAEELRAAIENVAGSDARIDFPVSASFGIAASRTSGYDLRELLANADSALYEAKREGRNRIATYKPVALASMDIAQAATSTT